MGLIGSHPAAAAGLQPPTRILKDGEGASAWVKGFIVLSLHDSMFLLSKYYLCISSCCLHLAPLLRPLQFSPSLIVIGSPQSSEDSWKTMVEDCHAGNLDAVKLFFEMMVETPEQLSARIRKKYLESAILASIREHHLPVLSYLLSQGVEITSSILISHGFLQSVDLLQVLFDNG